MRPSTLHHRFWILLYIITSLTVVAIQCTLADQHQQQQSQRAWRRHYNQKRAAAGGDSVSHTVPRGAGAGGRIGDSGSRVVLNATLQLNAAADNSDEQIIRIRDKDGNAARGQVVEEQQATSGSTLLDDKHQVSGSSDRGSAKVNLHAPDTIVNISSQVAVISATARPRTTSPPPRTSTRSSSTTQTTTTTTTSSHEDDVEEEDEGEEQARTSKVTTTMESTDNKKASIEGGADIANNNDNAAQKKPNSVATSNYNNAAVMTQPHSSSASGLQVASEVDLVVPPGASASAKHKQHDGVMNIERAIGENGEQMIIIAGEDDEDEVVNVHKNHFVEEASLMASQHKSDPVTEGEDEDEERDGPIIVDEPIALPLRPIIRDPFDEMDDEAHHGEMTIVYAELRSEVTINCEVDMDIAMNTWFHDGQMIHPVDRRGSRLTPDFRFIKEARGALTITNVMVEDNGKWTCEAENAQGYSENARPVKLVVLDRPKAPYLLIDSRRLDAGNIFIPVKENSELSLACVSEGGNPKPVLSWEILLSPGVDRHAQKITHELTHLEDAQKKDADKEPYKINSGSISEVKLPVVYRAHHNARILCVMEHPTLKVRLNASLLLDVQYTPSFAISRTPGFGYPLREGIEVSLKCDVDSNPSSTPIWQKDDGDPPVPQAGDGYLNFTSIKREHSGWYKCTARHLNFQYTSIGYYLSVRYDSVDVTSEPMEPDMSISSAAQHMFKTAQMEVQLGGAVTLQCPQGSLGCWSQLDPNSNRLRGLGSGQSMPTGQSMLKDVVYQDGGIYKCVGQNPNNKKKMEVLHTVAVAVKGPPTAVARNATPISHPGSPLHLYVEFCANPPAFAARWLHGDRIYTPGNQYGVDVLAYAVQDLPTPFCKEARLTYVRMHERVQRTFSFVVSSPGGVAEAIFKVNFTMRHKTMSNSVDDADEEELSEPEEIHFPVFGSSQNPIILRPLASLLLPALILPALLLLIRSSPV